jgi:hypothetical protein
MAVILNGHGADVGRTRLMSDCRGWGLLLVEPGRLNLPSQKASERGLLIERQRVCNDGRTRGYSLITKKGQMHLLWKYFPDGLPPRPFKCSLVAFN